MNENPAANVHRHNAKKHIAAMWWETEVGHMVDDRERALTISLAVLDRGSRG